MEILFSQILGTLGSSRVDAESEVSYFGAFALLSRIFLQISDLLSSSSTLFKPLLNFGFEEFF